MKKPTPAQARILERMKSGEILSSLLTTDPLLCQNIREYEFSAELDRKHVDGLTIAVVRAMRKKNLIEENKRSKISSDLWHITWKVKGE